MYTFAVVVLLFMVKGPEPLVPYLMDLICSVIPAQCTLYAIAALKKDFDKDRGEKATAGGESNTSTQLAPRSKLTRLPGNVNQRLLYMVFWVATQWVQLTRIDYLKRILLVQRVERVCAHHSTQVGLRHSLRQLLDSQRATGGIALHVSCGPHSWHCATRPFSVTLSMSV